MRTKNSVYNMMGVLGLYVVKTILAQHKEHITVTSENGLTSFDFTLQLTSPHNTER